MKNQTIEQTDAGNIQNNKPYSNISFYTSIIALTIIILSSFMVFNTPSDFFTIYFVCALSVMIFGITSIYYGNKMRRYKESYTKSELTKGNVGTLLSLIMIYSFVPLACVFMLISVTINVLQTH